MPAGLLTGNQCCGSVTFWYGTGCGSSDPYLWLTDPDADPGGPSTYGSYIPQLVRNKRNGDTTKRVCSFTLLSLLLVRWRAGRRMLGLCRRCAGPTTANTSSTQLFPTCQLASLSLSTLLLSAQLSATFQTSPSPVSATQGITTQPEPEFLNF